ncbi:hypothetical protein NFI96_011650, partial [Prochilodus magdalenae]
VLGKALLFIVVLGLGGGFQVGCHNTLISSPSPFIQSFINSSWTQRFGEAPGESTVTIIWSAIVSVYAFGGLLGSVSVRWVTNQLGRKRAMIWNNAINVVGLGCMVTSRFINSFEMIMISRLVFGFTSGLGMNLHTIYLGESAPKRIRGMVTLTVATFKAIGKLVGQFAGLSEILGREEWWNILLCVPALFSIIQMVTLPFFPEAPRYLLIEKGNTEQCKQALQCLWGPGDYKLEIEEMLVEQSSLRGERSKTLLELLRDQSVRWQLLCLFAVNGAIQFGGVSAISVFSFSIFQEAGIPVDKIRYVTLGVGVSEILTNITCGLLIDRVGRRVLLWAGFGSMAVIMALITVSLELKVTNFHPVTTPICSYYNLNPLTLPHHQDYASWVPYSTVALVFLFVICFGGGPAGVVPSLSHEIFVQSYRSAAFVFIGILTWAGFTVFGFIFPFLLATLKSFSFMLFSCSSLAASLYVFFILPETKGKTPLEISEEFRSIRACGSAGDDVCLETRLTPTAPPQIRYSQHCIDTDLVVVVLVCVVQVRGKALLFIIALGLAGSFQVGFHLTVISSPTPFIQSFINSSWTQRYGEAPEENTVTLIWSAVSSIFPFGALFGSISVRCITNHLGRKRALIWSNAISIVALGTMITSRFANSFEMIMLSRFLFGFTSGFGGNIHGLYLGDSSPKKIRGMVTLTMALFTSCGKLIGQVIGLSEILGREDWWNVLLCVPAFFSIISMVTLPFLPEAPRYLLIEKGNTLECKKALQCLWGPGDYKLEIEEMLVEQAALRGERSKTLLELLRDRSVRWQLLSMFVIFEAVQFSGITAFSLFSFSIFEEAGIPVEKIRYVTLGVGLCEVLTNITCGLLIDRVGRRLLLWAGFGFMAVTMILMTITLELKASDLFTLQPHFPYKECYGSLSSNAVTNEIDQFHLNPLSHYQEYSSWIPYSTVGLVFLFVIFYGGGPAGVMPSLGHEIFLQSYRPAAFGFFGILIWGGLSVLGFVFPFLLISLKSFSFVLFSCTCLTASLYVFFVLPETKAKTPMEISEEFRNLRVCSSSMDDVCLETKL